MQFGSTLLTVCHDHVTYEFQSESTPYSLPECQGTPCLSRNSCHLRFTLCPNVELQTSFVFSISYKGNIWQKKRKEKKKKKMKKNLYFKFVDSEKFLVQCLESFYGGSEETKRRKGLRFYSHCITILEVLLESMALSTLTYSCRWDYIRTQ